MSFCRSLALTTLVAAAPAWAINKCTFPDGSISYQDDPCPQKAVPARNAPAAARQQAADDPEAKALQEWLKREKAVWNGKQPSTPRPDPQEDRRQAMGRVCNGKYEQEPAVGMTEAVALHCLRTGEPTLVQETEAVGRIARIYSYTRAANGLSLHLVVKNGVVTLVQR